MIRNRLFLLSIKYCKLKILINLILSEINRLGPRDVYDMKKDVEVVLNGEKFRVEVGISIILREFINNKLI